MSKKLPYDVRKRIQHRKNIIKSYNTPSYYRGIKLICAWTVRDKKEAFIIPALNKKIIWIPEEYIKKVNEYKHVLKHGVNIDACFDEIRCPIEHIKKRLSLEKRKN